MEAMMDARAGLAAAGRRLDRLGFVPATDGNLSVRVAQDRLLVTPSGRPKGDLGEEELLVTDLDGRVVEGSGLPSSELPMHLAVYRRRPDVGAVVHAHPPTASGFSVAGVELTLPLLPEILLTVGPVPLTRYATPGTEEIPLSLAPFLDRHDAFLLANHGVLTLGKDLPEALHRMERVEHLARVALVARLLGGARELTAEQISSLLAVSAATVPADR
jgi:L-fuculose-phosphate aldolase